MLMRQPQRGKGARNSSIFREPPEPKGTRFALNVVRPVLRSDSFIVARHQVHVSFELGASFARNQNQPPHPTPLAVDSVATEFTSVVFRILHYRNSQCIRVVQNPENHRNESGGGSIDSLPVSVDGRISQTRRGFSFLGSESDQAGIVDVAPATRKKFVERISQLYEQGASLTRIGNYVRRWKTWIRSGRSHIDQWLGRFLRRC